MLIYQIYYLDVAQCGKFSLSGVRRNGWNYCNEYKRLFQKVKRCSQHETVCLPVFVMIGFWWTMIIAIYAGCCSHTHLLHSVPVTSIFVVLVCGFYHLSIAKLTCSSIQFSSEVFILRMLPEKSNIISCPVACTFCYGNGGIVDERAF